MAIKNTEVSVIGAVTEITGNVTGSGSLRIEGRLQGNADVTGDIEVARDAQVQGDVIGRSLVLEGSLNGNATAADLISIGPAANYQGSLRAERISITPGARVSAQFDADFDLKLSI